jgi:hypothetical protein
MNKYTESIVILLFIAVIIQGSLLVISFGNSLVESEKAKISDSERTNRILSDLMDQTIGACYYDTYQSNETNYNADICNKIMMFNKQVCMNFTLDSCNSDYLRKYLKNMEG